MFRRHDVSLTVAVCLSLVAHAGIAWTLLEGEAREESRRVAQGPVDRRAVEAGPILVEERALVKAPVEKRVEREEELPKLPPLPARKPEARLLKSIFGEAEGRGDAEHASPGEEEMRAKRVAPEEQAFLSRDPEGMGRVGDAPSMSTAKAGREGSGKAGPIRKAQEEVKATVGKEKPALTAMLEQQAPAGVEEVRREKSREVNEKPLPEVAFGVPEERVEEVVAKHARKVVDGPGMIAAANPNGMRAVEGSESARDEKDVVEKKGQVARQGAPAVKPAGVPGEATPVVKMAIVPPVVAAGVPERAAAVRQAASGGSAEKTSPSADPAPMSDSEADAFGKVANVEFSNGRVEAQFGRRIKTVRPKLLLSAEYEIFSQENPRVLLSAKVDATGHVTKAEIYQSSGSPDLDQPCLVAVYDWWFEPPKDKEGKPMADVVVVGITFRH